MLEVEERVICAAIWYKELKLKNPGVLKNRGFMPYNCDRGIVFSGWRHPSCMYQMVAIYDKSDHEVGERIDGFLTNKNRFVGRKEAAKIALECGQIEKLNYSDSILYSEDLY